MEGVGRIDSQACSTSLFDSTERRQTCDWKPVQVRWLSTLDLIENANEDAIFLQDSTFSYLPFESRRHASTRAIF